MIMNDYSKKIVYVPPYRQMQFIYDLSYIELTRLEENQKFLSKYCKLNEQLKREEQY